MDLPLLKRELLELAQRRRTYALRGLVWLVFFVVFLIAYLSVTSHTTRVMQVLGRGSQITEVLFVTLMLTIYVLNPAMACTAITSEKERQTLGLLIVSKLTPSGIVAEKILSHMLPLGTLLLIATPLFAVAYLFGGVSMADTLVGLFILLSTTLQVTTIAVFCSALLESGIAAFWCTYLILAVVYFTLPIMRELHMIRLDISTLPDEEFLLFPVYQLAMLIDMRRELSTILLLTIPTFLITGCLAIAARFAVIKYSYGAAFSFARQFQTLNRGWNQWRRRLWNRRLWNQRPVVQQNSGSRAESVAAAADANEADQDAILKQSRLIDQPIAWRELRGRLVGSRTLQSIFIGGVVFLTWLLMSANQNDKEEISAVMSIGFLVVAVLLILSVSCRLFATERERQTLDALLTTPMSNRELLSQKLRGVHRLLLLLLIPVVLLGLLNLFQTDVRVYTPVIRNGAVSGYPGYGRTTVYVYQGQWWSVAFRFLFCAASCTWVYLHLAKWVAVYWGLQLHTQMKAMLASILSIAALCLIPLLITTGCLIAGDNNPDDFPFFFFMSPAVIPCLNEVHELHEVYRRNWIPDSEWVVVLINLAVYGALTLTLRSFVLHQVPRLLNRPEVAAPVAIQST
ncbi:MAG: ABC transporter permease subunit [Fuerstiella sp.]